MMYEDNPVSRNENNDEDDNRSLGRKVGAMANFRGLSPFQWLWVLACPFKVVYGAYLVTKSYHQYEELTNSIEFWLFRNRPDTDWQCLQDSIGSDKCTILPPDGFTTEQYPSGVDSAASTSAFAVWRTDCHSNIQQLLDWCILLAVVSVLVSAVAMLWAIRLVGRHKPGSSNFEAKLWQADVSQFQTVEALFESVLWVVGAFIFLFWIRPKLLPPGGGTGMSQQWAPHDTSMNNVGLPQYYGSTFCPWKEATDLKHSTECTHFPSSRAVTSVRIRAKNEGDSCLDIPAWKEAMKIDSSGSCQKSGIGDQLLECCIQIDSFFPCGKSGNWYSDRGKPRPSDQKLCGGTCKELDKVLGFAYKALFQMYFFGLAEGLWDILMLGSSVKKLIEGFTSAAESLNPDKNGADRDEQAKEKLSKRKKMALRIFKYCLIGMIPFGVFLFTPEVLAGYGWPFGSAIECRDGEHRVEDVCRRDKVARKAGLSFSDHPECIDHAFMLNHSNYSVHDETNCRAGFTGPTCGEPIPFCVWKPNPCQNGGKCCSRKGRTDKETPTAHPACVDCDDGWKSDRAGPLCASRVPYCERRTNPCKAGAECVSIGFDKYSCECSQTGYDPEHGCKSCVSGYYGQKCDKHCSTCNGHGSCNTNSGTCMCDARFAGTQCEKCKKPKYDPERSCSECIKRRYDPKHNCETCVYGWEGADCAVWPSSFTFKGTVQNTKSHKGIVGEYMKTTVMSNGAPVYQSANPKVWRSRPAFLYRYLEGFGGGGCSFSCSADRDGVGCKAGGVGCPNAIPSSNLSGSLIWLIGTTSRSKPQDVNDPDHSASEKYTGYKALFDSSPSSAEGDCAHNPTSPSCTWRECKSNYACHPYPVTSIIPDEHDEVRAENWPRISWYGGSASLKVVVAPKGGGSG